MHNIQSFMFQVNVFHSHVIMIITDVCICFYKRLFEFKPEYEEPVAIVEGLRVFGIMLEHNYANIKTKFCRFRDSVLFSLLF